ncbi:MAG: hypothetical protein QHH75_07705 [Bacillota bacterium]|nr:hypothetical protein [Bacillota bacterium]
MRNTGHEGRTFRSTASFGKRQENAGRYTINFCNVRADGTVAPRPKFDRYKNNFSLLE